MTNRAKCWSSVATIALSTALLASPAWAFDNLEWNWNKRVEEVVVKEILVTSTIEPTGMVEVEKLQVQIGDVNANSTVFDIVNTPPGVANGENGVFTFSETFVVETTEDEDDPGLDIAPISPIEGDDPDNGVTGHFNGGEIIEIDDAPDEIILEFFVEGEVPIEALEIAPLDAATELPTIESAATAVGNNQSITSDASVQLHDAQILFDVCGGCGDDNTGIGETNLAALGAGLDLLASRTDTDGETTDPETGEIVPNPDDGVDGNLFHGVGLATALAAAVGVIDKADVTATSTVFNITNARVDSDATAVGNNINVDMSAALGGDRLLIGDITQVSVADITATSSVNDVTVTGYTNLAAVNPLVSSTATAVGNNVNITVGGGAGIATDIGE